MGKKDTFSIRQMIELTGLSEFTIRSWENRYSSFKPQRSDTGRRIYSKGDVERAILLRELLKRGHRIGGLAGLSTQKLKGLFEQVEGKAANEQRSDLIAQVMEFVALQKWSDLKLLIKKIPNRDTNQLFHKFFLPTLRALNSNVETGLVSISQEHILSSFLKEKIYSAVAEMETKKTLNRAHQKIQFVLATPEGDYHEIGLLLAHLLIRSHGFNSLYLGPHMPARDLSETALRFNASHLLIVSTVSKKGGAHQDVLSFVSEVQKRIGSHSTILIAGSQSPLIAYDPHSDLFNLESFHEFEKYLQQLGAKS